MLVICLLLLLVLYNSNGIKNIIIIIDSSSSSSSSINLVMGTGCNSNATIRDYAIIYYTLYIYM